MGGRSSTGNTSKGSSEVVLDSNPGLLDNRRDAGVRKETVNSDLPRADNGSGEERLGVSESQEDEEDGGLDPRASLES